MTTMNYKKLFTDVMIRRLFFLLRRSGFIYLAIFIFVLPAFGQSNYQVPHGSSSANTASGSPAGSYALSGFESVNPFSGKVNFSMPLYKIGGRGSAGFPVNLTIERNWSINHEVNDPNFYQEVSELYAITHRYTPDDGTSFIGPQSTTTMPGFMGFMRGNRMGRNQAYRLCGTEPCYDIAWTTLTFVQSDGTEINFRDVVKEGRATGSYDTNLSRGTEWVSTDATGATFTSSSTISDIRIKSQIYDGIFYPSGTLRLPNGTKFTIQNGHVTEIFDINGNKVTRTTDSLGREITVSVNYNPSPDVYFERVYNLKGIGGAVRQIKVNYSFLSHRLSSGYALTDQWEMFGLNRPVNIPETPYDGLVVSSLVLQNGAKYEFRYNNYGELTEINLPTGGRIEYVWQSSPGVYGIPEEPEVIPASHQPPDDKPNLRVYRRVEKRRVYEGNELKTETVYDSPETNISDNTSRVTVFNYAKENGTLVLTSKSKHYYYGQAAPDALYGYAAEEGTHLYGREFKTENFDSTGTNLVQRTLQNWYQTPPGWWTGNPKSAPANDTRLAGSVSVIIENGNALATLSKTEYDETGSSDPAYFSHLNVKRSKAYNYKVLSLSTAQNADFETIAGMFSESDLASVAETDYLYNSNYKARGILSLPTETRAIDGAANQLLAKSQVVYDNAFPAADSDYPYSMETYNLGTSFDCSLTTNVQKICWQDPNSAYRGNPTTSRLWDSDNNAWIETHTRYDTFGNAIKVKDAVGNEAQTIFEHNAIDKPYFYAYPTKVITPAPDPTGTHGTNQTSTVETTYDFTTGLPLKVKNDFGQEVQTEYDDMLRPFRVSPVAPLIAPVAETVYGAPDANGQLPASQRFVKVRKQIDANNWDEATTWFDELGRTIKTQSKDSQGDVFVETQYDSLGRVKQTSNPYRQGDTVYWSKPRYDELGRAVEAFAPATSGQTGASLGVTSYSISTVPNFVGTVVTTSDASGRKGRSITNALGQLLRVDEPQNIGGTADGDLGTLASPLQPTFYKYNAQGKMVEVEQGAQKRFFKYDSLGRLIRVRQPEQDVNSALNLADGFNTTGQWTAAFSYDLLGNVKRATDANGSNIIYEYDKANRVTMRCYTKPNFQTSATQCGQISGGDVSPNTPAVEYFYDGLGLDTAPPAINNFAKGKLTKVTSSVSETRYTQFDYLGRLLESKQITDGQTYKSNYDYNFSGALIKQTYPNGREVKNEFEADGDLSRIYGKANANAIERTYANSFSYMPDGRIEKLRLGNHRWEWAKFNERLQVTELNLGSGVNDASLWKLKYDYGEINSNGNVDVNKNTGNIARQTTSFNGLAQPFVQSFKYDSLYRLTEARETTNSNQTWKQSFSYDRYGNRVGYENFVGVTQQVLDKKTHPTINPQTNRFNTNQDYQYDFNGNLISDAENRQFIFNGDNKQTEIKNGNINVGKYFYDGEGKRVKKITNLETVIFVYDGLGKIVAEYSTKEPPPNPTTSYTATDQLGSPRVITNSNGEVTSRRDFQPFGEELFPDGANRTSALKYGTSDGIRQKFTSYQRDEETLLDFAEARMYENRHARFTAVDPLLASGKSANPQTFNRYIYVGNNPINITDPFGLDWFSKYNESTKRTNYLWSEDNKNFSDGTSVDGWDRQEFGRIIGEIIVDNACANADCTETNTAYLQQGGKVEWAGFLRDMRQEFFEEMPRNFSKAFSAEGVKRDWNYFWEDPLGERGLGNPALAFVTGGLSSQTQSFKGFNLFNTAAKAENNFVNITNATRTAHILKGDATGGGHAWFASIKSFTNGLLGKKSMFPAKWSQDKIMNAIGEVATNPNNRWIQQTGRIGDRFTRSGQPVRFKVEGIYEGVRVRVITTYEEIITAFPLR